MSYPIGKPSDRRDIQFIQCRGVVLNVPYPTWGWLRNFPSCRFGRILVTLCQELELLSLRETKAHHLQAADAAMTYADQLEQLSRPVGRSAGVWLGRAAVALEAGDPASALHDLERAAVQLRGSAKVCTLEAVLGGKGGRGGR